MLGMDVDTVVPGHGPLTDKAGIVAVRDYLAFVDAEATRATTPGSTRSTPHATSPGEIGADERFHDVGRVRTDRGQRRDGVPHLDPEHRTPDVVEQFRRMAEMESHTR